MTHAELVERAAKWLSREHVVVGTELGTWGVSEYPDALGWFDSAGTTLVECKATIEDFRRDRTKSARRNPETGLGNYRWYMTPPGLLTVDDLPERWGLLECHARQIRTKRVADFNRDKARTAEIQLLISVIRRLGVNGQGISCRKYTVPTANTVGIWIQPELPLNGAEGEKREEG